MYPFRFKPVYQSYVWGGNRIPHLYQRPTPFGDRFAESWEVSIRPEGMSVLDNGPWKGKTLQELVKELGASLLGKGREQFPLLIKLIDAKENLSVQVHPNEVDAKRLSAEAKTEMWVALEESFVFAGLKKPVSKKVFEKAIEDASLEQLLQPLDLKKGEALFISGGMIHAICGNSLLLEIQQNSNTTYRLYDWGRKERELHLKEGLSCVDWNEPPPRPILPQKFDEGAELLAMCPFFTVKRFFCENRLTFAFDPTRFQIFFCVEGEGLIRAEGAKEPLQPGMTYLIPASAQGVSINGRCQVIQILP